MLKLSGKVENHTSSVALNEERNDDYYSSIQHGPTRSAEKYAIICDNISEATNMKPNYNEKPAICKGKTEGTTPSSPGGYQVESKRT